MVTDLSFARSRGYIKYQYSYEGIRYHGYNMIMRTGPSGKVKMGEIVTVYLRPERPELAAVAQLYL